MAIVRELYNPVDEANEVLEKLEEMDRKRAERVISAYYENEKKRKKLLRRNNSYKK